MQTTDTNLMAALLYALCGLTYEHPANQRELLKVEYISAILVLTETHVNNAAIVASSAELLSNISVKN
jgi:hypothetical protein